MKDQWEYVALFFGSIDLDQGFYSIPRVETDMQPIEQINYGHITIKEGEVTCRDIEHDLMCGIILCISIGGFLPR
jgi:hypothetical protein